MRCGLLRIDVDRQPIHQLSRKPMSINGAGHCLTELGRHRDACSRPVIAFGSQLGAGVQWDRVIGLGIIHLQHLVKSPSGSLLAHQVNTNFDSKLFNLCAKVSARFNIVDNSSHFSNHPTFASPSPPQVRTFVKH